MYLCAVTHYIEILISAVLQHTQDNPEVIQGHPAVQHLEGLSGPQVHLEGLWDLRERLLRFVSAA